MALSESLRARALAADLGEALPPPADASTSAQPSPPPAPEQQEAQEWRGAAVHIGQAVRDLLPVTREAWTDEKLAAFGDALARCAQHYGWKFGDALNHPLLALALASVPLVWPVARPLLEPRLARLMGKRPDTPPPAPPPDTPPESPNPAPELPPEMPKGAA